MVPPLALTPSAVRGRKLPGSLRLVSRIWCSRRRCFPGRSRRGHRERVVPRLHRTAREDFGCHLGAKSIAQRQRFRKTVRNETVAASVRRGDPVVSLSAIKLETEADARHYGTVLEFCEVTNTSVSSGHALALVVVAAGIRVLAMSDEEVENFDCDQDGLAPVVKWIQESLLAGMLHPCARPRMIARAPASSSAGHGRGFPRPAPLRPTLPQPGPDVRLGYSADLSSARVLHCGSFLRQPWPTTTSS